MNKTALIISIALTTFVLMVVGGIAYAVRASETAQAAAELPSGSIDPALEQALNQRESAYQEMIAEANTRLEQSQQQQQALEAQLATLTNNSSASASLTPEEAATIASNFLGNTSVYSVETVTVYGESIFKVTFSSGDIVYVNLGGQIVGSEAAPKVVAAQIKNPAKNAGHNEHEDEDDD